jgi:hypothetical protein
MDLRVQGLAGQSCSCSFFISFWQRYDVYSVFFQYHID